MSTSRESPQIRARSYLGNLAAALHAGVKCLQELKSLQLARQVNFSVNPALG